jgi:hypothetical protein
MLSVWLDYRRRLQHVRHTSLSLPQQLPRLINETIRMDATTATDTPAEGATATGAAAAPSPNMDPNFILTLARDNKAAELIALVQQGYPVNAGNKVGDLQGLGWPSLGHFLTPKQAASTIQCNQPE